MNLLLRNCILTKKFCISKEDLYSLVYHIKDVTVIKGMKTEQPYIKLDEHVLTFDPKKLVADLELPSGLKKQGVKIQFLDKNLRTYHPYVYFHIILQQSFYVKYNNLLYHVLTNQPLIKKPQNPQFEATMAPASLEPVVLKVLQQLNHHPKITKQDLQQLIFQTMTEQSFKLKIQALHTRQLLKVVNDKLKNFDSIVVQQTIKLKKKANRKINLLATGLLAQVGIINYLSYFHLSWDIMQPITCIIANLNVAIAFLYFSRKQQELSFENVLANTIESKKSKYLIKQGMSPEKYNELKAIQDYLNFRLNILSKNQAHVMSQLDENLIILDTD